MSTNISSIFYVCVFIWIRNFIYLLEKSKEVDFVRVNVLLLIDTFKNMGIFAEFTRIIE